MDINLEPTAFNLVAGALGGFLLLHGGVSSIVKERLYLSEPPFAILIGIALERLNVIPKNLIGSPDGTQDRLDDFSVGFSRFILGVQLIIVGIELPYRYVWVEWRSLAVLLLPLMLAMWLVTTGITMLVLPGVSVLAALVIASCATPTDPVLSNAIITGEFANMHISPRIRNLISAESGANDGFAYPFLFIALRLLKEPTTSEALFSWLIKTVVYQVCGAVVIGAIVGILANRLLRWATRHNAIDKESFLCYGVATGIFTIGLAGFLDTDDLLAAFAAGNAFTWDDWYRKETEQEGLSPELSLLLDTSFFMYVGATIPWDSFHSTELGLTPGRLVLLGLLVLLFRRLPAMLMFYRLIPRIKTASEAAMMGYFGPIGAGAIFYASLVVEELRGEKDYGKDGLRITELVKPVTYALVIASFLGHSLAIPLVRLVFKRLHVGNIKLIGNEGGGLGDDDDSIAEQHEAASDGAPASEGSINEQAQQDETNTGHGKYPLYLYPKGKGAYLLDGSYKAQASWRQSGRHGPSEGYQYHGDGFEHGGHAHGSSQSRRNKYQYIATPEDNDLPDEWNARVRYLDEEAGGAPQQQSSEARRASRSSRQEAQGDDADQQPQSLRPGSPQRGGRSMSFN